MRPFQYVIWLFFAAWAMGAVFDIYNIVTGASKWLRWIRPVLDLLFWVLSAGFVFLILFHTDNGRLRLYTFLLLGLGYLAYRAVLHRAVAGSAFAVVRLIRFVLRLLFGIVDALLLRPVYWGWRLLWRLARVLYLLLRRVEDFVFWVLGFWFRLLAGWWWHRLTDRPAIRQTRSRIQSRWEGFWTRASNWIRKHPRQA